MVIQRLNRVLATFFFLLSLVFSDENAPCYLPNGSQAFGFLPCNVFARVTSCCPMGWTCYSNSMCVVTDPSTANSAYPIGTSMRGSCTNPEWDNAFCGDYCLVRSRMRCRTLGLTPSRAIKILVED